MIAPNKWKRNPSITKVDVDVSNVVEPDSYIGAERSLMVKAISTKRYVRRASRHFSIPTTPPLEWVVRISSPFSFLIVSFSRFLALWRNPDSKKNDDCLSPNWTHWNAKAKLFPSNNERMLSQRRFQKSNKNWANSKRIWKSCSRVRRLNSILPGSTTKWPKSWSAPRDGMNRGCMRAHTKKCHRDCVGNSLILCSKSLKHILVNAWLVF